MKQLKITINLKYENEHIKWPILYVNANVKDYQEQDLGLWMSMHSQKSQVPLE